MGTWVVFALFGQAGGLNSLDRPGVLLVGTILLGLCSGPVRGGYDWAMLRFLRGDDTVGFGAVFSGFTKFWLLLGVQLGLALALAVVGSVMLGALLIVPEELGMVGTILRSSLIALGVFVALRLAIGLCFSFLLVMEVDLDARDALMGSWRLTGGHRWKLFLLFLLGGALEAVVVGVAALGYYLLDAVAGMEATGLALGGFLLMTGSMVVGSVSQLALIGAYRVLREDQVDGGAVGVVG